MASDATLQAVLGPTNTGKTHLAIERMCAHSSGAMGFPLRLLAREVYDRVVAIKGAASVALLTGEEKIRPPTARYTLATMESLPRGGDFAFVGLDEAQLGADAGARTHLHRPDAATCARPRGNDDPGRGNAGGRWCARWCPMREIVTSRPRFSTLSYAGAKQTLAPAAALRRLSRFRSRKSMPIAEMLRRFSVAARRW